MIAATLGLCLASSLALAHSRFYKSTNKEFPRVKERNVLYGLKKPDSAIEIGVIVVHTKKEVGAITDARKWAARNGANYIVLVTSKDMTAGQSVANAFLHVGQRGKWVFLAYRKESELVKK